MGRHLRSWGLAGLLFSAALPGLAQDRAQTLADIRAELATLNRSVTGLRGELAATGAGGVSSANGPALQRLDTIEAALADLTAKTEKLEFRIDQVVTDGTNRIGDLDFRITELEGGDTSKAGTAKPLGGEAAGAPAAVVAPPATAGGSLAVNEQADFDRAQGVLGQGDFRGAADLLATFAQTYPGGALTPEANFQRGEALSKLGETSNAARAWLEAFSGDMTGPRAPEALLKVGQALGSLGQGPEACVTLAEVTARFPATAAAAEAATARQGLGCR